MVAFAVLVLGSASACTSQAASSAADSASAANAGSLEGVRRQNSNANAIATADRPLMVGTDDAMTNSMQAHMRMAANMTAEQLVATLPTHRHMVTNMLSQMNGEMRRMKMPADAVWMATIDSVRQDLTRLPEMTKPELQQVMPAHLARLSRVMQIQKGMTTPMGK